MIYGIDNYDDIRDSINDSLADGNLVFSDRLSSQGLHAFWLGAPELILTDEELAELPEVSGIYESSYGLNYALAYTDRKCGFYKDSDGNRYVAPNDRFILMPADFPHPYCEDIALRFGKVFNAEKMFFAYNGGECAYQLEGRFAEEPVRIYPDGSRLIRKKTEE